jgi:hypothetical protein
MEMEELEESVAGIIPISGCGLAIVFVGVLGGRFTGEPMRSGREKRSGEFRYDAREELSS